MSMNLSIYHLRILILAYESRLPSRYRRCNQSINSVLDSTTQGMTITFLFLISMINSNDIKLLLMQVAIGSILHLYLKKAGSLDKGLATAVVVLVCLFVMSFAWSWGPLGWLIPSEIFPLETRTAGFAFAVSSNMLFTFLIAQLFLSMLCHMQAFIFFFFAAWILAMGLFVLFLLPETKGIPSDLMNDTVWRKHPFWKKFMGRDVIIVTDEMA